MSDKFEACLWCGFGVRQLVCIDPYDAVHGFENHVPMCPYCYAHRCTLALIAVINADVHVRREMLVRFPKKVNP